MELSGLPDDLHLARILELLRSDPGKRCWIENHSRHTEEVGKEMKPFRPGDRLYLGTKQKLRAATGLTPATERTARKAVSGEWAEMKPQTASRIAALLQVLYSNQCPLLDPKYPDLPIVFWDDPNPDGLAAWEKIMHLHNRYFQPYQQLPEILNAYFRLGRLFIPTKHVESSAIDRITLTAKTGKNTQSNLVGAYAVDLLKALIKADMQRRGISDVPLYIAAIVAEVSDKTVEQATSQPDYLYCLTGVKSILDASKMPPVDVEDSTFTYLAAALKTVDGNPFGGNVSALLQYCGLKNGNTTKAS